MTIQSGSNVTRTQIARQNTDTTLSGAQSAHHQGNRVLPKTNQHLLIAWEAALSRALTAHKETMIEDVKTSAFPEDQHCYHIMKGEEDRFASMLKKFE